MHTELFEMVNSLVNEELDLYKSLEQLVDIEEQRVVESDTDGLLDVLRLKQGIISRQETLLESWGEISQSLGIPMGKESSPFLKALSERIGEAGYKHIADGIEDILRMGQRLLSREETIRGMLEANIVEMRKKLVRLGRNRTAVKGYSQGIASGM
ncbi:hypothetical protein FACS1894167_02680 [Synergistales bacterium]|nr:hypothetical protein FACS1894167_02680 [Synergistales bacterium]GHV54971.1 hypothetical protein FACS1894216_16080 [Synergistales bacterium]